METVVHEGKHLVEIWLTRAESSDPKLREKLKPLYDKYSDMKYLVAVFESGNRDLYRATSDLLCYNRRRCAELKVKKDKQISRQCRVLN